tara:strand:- start:1027 stop:1473 length:447 start_codon:yes stop_codon:yes gene_type:complete
MSAINKTEARFREALQRLLSGSPIRTKASGKLTFNKINNEAGAGHSYINKACFKDFRKDIKPEIDVYNEKKNSALEGGVVLPEVNLTPEENLKIDLNREINLKVRYRKERDDARKAKEELEAIHNILLFRIYDLQEELRPLKVASIKS